MKGTILSKSCEYALRALLYIALNTNENKKAGIKEIAEALDIPSHFVGKILQNLVRHHILSSVKGPNGGYYITHEHMQTSLFSIVEMLDNPEFFYKCGLGLKRCSNKHPCPIHHEFQPYRDHLKQIFEEKTLASLTEEIAAKPDNMRVL